MLVRPVGDLFNQTFRKPNSYERIDARRRATALFLFYDY